MIEKLKTYGLYGKWYCAIEITTNVDRDIYYGVLASNKNGEFVNVSFFSCNSMDELSKKVPKGTHCFLIVNTGQVLINNSGLKTNDAELVNEAFPSLNKKEFYFEILKTSKRAFVSICRKTIVDRFMKDLDHSGLNVLGFHLGFGAVKNLVRLIPSQIIKTSTHTLTVVDAEIDGFKENQDLSNENYVVEEMNFDSNHVLCLAGLFDYLGNSGLISNGNEENNRRFQNFRQKTLFKKGIISAAALLLGCLVLNAILFNSYYGKLQELEQQSQIVSSQRQNYLKRQTEIERKEQIVRNIQLSGKSKSSFFLNRLMIAKPETVQLSLFEYQPLQKSIRAEEPIKYDEQLIKVEGISISKTMFNQWMQAIEKNEWIEGVQTYQYSENNNSSVNFGIKLKTLNVSKK